jgi:hypothetical protein
MYRYLVKSHAPHWAFDLLGKISLRLRKYAPDCVDLRGLAENPLKASYLSPDQKFLFDVDLDQCLGLHSAAFGCSSTSAHPFIRTLQAFVNDGCDSYVNSQLKVFYDSFQPRSAAEAVGLSAGLSHPELVTRSPFASSLPWDFLTPAQNDTFLRAICARDYAENGFALTADAGWKVWGPISDEAGQAEFSRLLHIFNSVTRSGYQRHAALDGDIEGQVMTDGSVCRVLISRGQHRIAALAATGSKTAPVRLLPKMISRSEVAFWPNVDRGFYTMDQALSVFDRMFQGRQPGALGKASGSDRKFA